MFAVSSAAHIDPGGPKSQQFGPLATDAAQRSCRPSRGVFLFHVVRVSP